MGTHMKISPPENTKVIGDSRSGNRKKQLDENYTP